MTFQSKPNSRVKVTVVVVRQDFADCRFALKRQMCYNWGNF